MRKFFWLILFVGGYIWVITSGHDDFVLEKGKMIYKAIVTWFDGAEVDFNLTEETTKTESKKKRSRRWD